MDGRSGSGLKQDHSTVSSDFDLPDLDRIKILEEAKRIAPDLAVVMVTAKG
jgi:DNA-binding NtrC family response regulator